LLGKNTTYELLKYHKLGIPKYDSLHKPYPMGDVSLSDELFENLKIIANSI
jgi:pyruvate formate lyase activating enzyme